MKTVVAKKDGDIFVTYEISSESLNLLELAMKSEYPSKDESLMLINLGLLEEIEIKNKIFVKPTLLGRKVLRTMKLIGVGDLCILKGSGWKIPMKIMKIDGSRVFTSLRKGAVFFTKNRLRHATAEETELYNEKNCNEI